MNISLLRSIDRMVQALRSGRQHHEPKLELWNVNFSTADALRMRNRILTVREAWQAIDCLKAHIEQFQEHESLIDFLNKELFTAQVRQASEVQAQNRIGSVYLACSGWHRNTKIGFTRNPEKRLKGLLTSDPKTRFRWVSKPALDISEEKQLHKQYRHKHVGKEWFALSPQDQEEIILNLENRTQQ